MKLYDKNQGNSAVTHYTVIDGQIVEVIAPVPAPENRHMSETIAMHKIPAERTYKRRGRCEDAPCCGCCD